MICRLVSWLEVRGAFFFMLVRSALLTVPFLVFSLMECDEEGRRTQALPQLQHEFRIFLEEKRLGSLYDALTNVGVDTVERLRQMSKEVVEGLPIDEKSRQTLCDLSAQPKECDEVAKAIAWFDAECESIRASFQSRIANVLCEYTAALNDAKERRNVMLRSHKEAVKVPISRQKVASSETVQLMEDCKALGLKHDLQDEPQVLRQKLLCFLARQRFWNEVLPEATRCTTVTDDLDDTLTCQERKRARADGKSKQARQIASSFCLNTFGSPSVSPFEAVLLREPANIGSLLASLKQGTASRHQLEEMLSSSVALT